MRSAVSAIARQSILEILHARSTLGALATYAACLGGSVFLRMLAIADGQRLQTAFLAASLRLASALVLGLTIIGAEVRAHNDRVLAFTLAQPIHRSAYVFGRYLGHVLWGGLLATLASLLLSLTADRGALAWGLALFSELAVLAAFALFAALGVAQFAAAMLLYLGFYLLARTLGPLALLAGQDGWQGFAVAVAAHLVPDFSAYAASQRLFVLEAGQDLGRVALEAGLYSVLLLAAAALDLARRGR